MPSQEKTLELAKEKFQAQMRVQYPLVNMVIDGVNYQAHPARNTITVCWDTGSQRETGGWVYIRNNCPYALKLYIDTFYRHEYKTTWIGGSDTTPFHKDTWKSANQIQLLAPNQKAEIHSPEKTDFKTIKKVLGKEHKRKNEYRVKIILQKYAYTTTEQETVKEWYDKVVNSPDFPGKGKTCMVTIGVMLSLIGLFLFYVVAL